MSRRNITRKKKVAAQASKPAPKQEESEKGARIVAAVTPNGDNYDLTAHVSGEDEMVWAGVVGILVAALKEAKPETVERVRQMLIDTCDSASESKADKTTD